MIRINAKTNVVLKTEGKYCEEDILVQVPSTEEPKLQDKTITQNGKYSADNGYDGIGTVVVSVDVGDSSVFTNYIRDVTTEVEVR